MNEELSRIKAKIRALASKTTDNGCTEAEAMAAMAMVGRLLKSYNLSMDECDVRESPCVTVTIPVDGSQRGPMDWAVPSLATLFSGRAWFGTDYKRTNKGYLRQVYYAFFVQEHDADALRYLFDVIKHGIAGETKAYQTTEEYRALTGGQKRSALKSFPRGMSMRIAERLRAMRKENDEAMAERQRASGSTGTALMVLKGQLIQEEFKKTGVRLRTVSSSARIGNHGAYHHGREAGNRVNLNRPIGGNGNVSGYLS